jgi:hypothetical protein
VLPLAGPEGYTVQARFEQASLDHILRAVYLIAGRAVMNVSNVVSTRDGLPVVTFGPVAADQLRSL